VFLGLKAKMSFISIVYNDWEWNGQGAMFPHIDQEQDPHSHRVALYAEFSGGNLASGDYAIG
jgi:hypothetical protein